MGLTHGSPEVKAAGRLLLGEDPTRVEHLWEKLYGALRPNVRPVAILDLALWDLLGKIRGEPVYRLLGGPTRERVRAYARCWGSPRSRSAPPRARWSGCVELHGPQVVPPPQRPGRPAGPGPERGPHRAVREAVGPEVQIMVDCLLSNPRANSLLYAIDLARRLEPYRPAWIE